MTAWTERGPGEAVPPGQKTGPRPDRALAVLDEEECRQLLGTAVIGRIAFTEQGYPAVQPVHFTLVGNDIYIPTRAGSKASAAERNAVVAFEADAFDPTGRTGWNVTAAGRSELLTDPRHIAQLTALGLLPWAPTPHLRYVVIQVSRWQGRRIHAPVMLH